jgi:uncharacterized protein (TIGR03067 family)
MKNSLAGAILFVTFCNPAPAVDSAPAGDLARFQGGWAAKAGAEQKIRVSLDVEGRRARVKIVTPQGLTLVASGELKIDEAASPRSLDWVKFSGPDGTQFPEIQAIYEFRGESLRVCNGGPNNGRPTAFADGDGALSGVVVFERPAPGK